MFRSITQIMVAMYFSFNDSTLRTNLRFNYLLSLNSACKLCMCFTLLWMINFIQLRSFSQPLFVSFDFHILGIVCFKIFLLSFLISWLCPINYFHLSMLLKKSLSLKLSHSISMILSPYSNTRFAIRRIINSSWREPINRLYDFTIYTKFHDLIIPNKGMIVKEYTRR